MAVETEDQATMFPELDDSAEHKKLLRAARSYARAKKERDELLGSSKEKCDGLMEKVVAAMHDAKLTRFKHDGTKCELIEGREKVVVKTDDEEEGEDGEDE